MKIGKRKFISAEIIFLLFVKFTVGIKLQLPVSLLEHCIEIKITSLGTAK